MGVGALPEIGEIARWEEVVLSILMHQKLLTKSFYSIPCVGRRTSAVMACALSKDGSYSCCDSMVHC